MQLLHGPTSSLLDLTGRTALVTAAGQGLGRGIAFRLADAGANLVVSARRQEQADTVAAEIVAAGGKAIGVVIDATCTEHYPPALDKAEQAFGGVVDILVNVAGGMHPFTDYLDVDEATWQATTERNMKGT